MPTGVALLNATLVLGDKAGTVVPAQTVLVDAEGNIDQVGPAETVRPPAGAHLIDATSRFVMPGIINAHAHLFADGRPLPGFLTSESAENLVASFARGPLGRRLVARRTRTNITTQMRSGVTTLRSLGDIAYEVVAVRDAVDRGDVLGPRIIASGPLMAVTGGHGAPQIALTSDSPWEARRNVRRNLRHGVSAIKIAATGGVTDARTIGEAGQPQMTEEEMTAICEEAHNAGVLVAAHAQSVEGITRALRAGVDTIEHGAAMTPEIIDLFNSNPRSLRGFSGLVPTLHAALPLVEFDRSVTGINPIVHANAKLIYDQMLAGIQDARDNDILIGMGTDSSLTFVTHYNAWREIDFVARRAGLGSAAAIHAATQANAVLLGIGHITGSLKTGKSADLLVLSGNPLDDLRALANPHSVIVRGKVIDDLEVRRFHNVDALLDTL